MSQEPLKVGDRVTLNFRAIPDWSRIPLLARKPGKTFRVQYLQTTLRERTVQLKYRGRGFTLPLYAVKKVHEEGGS